MCVVACVFRTAYTAPTEGGLTHSTLAVGTIAHVYYTVYMYMVLCYSCRRYMLYMFITQCMCTVCAVL